MDYNVKVITIVLIYILHNKSYMNDEMSYATKYSMNPCKQRKKK